MVEVVQAMFPQVSPAAIRYDLERNGGSIEATTERILAGRMETVSYANLMLAVHSAADPR